MPRRFGTSKDRKTMYFSLVSPLDPNSHTKYKPYLHMKNHHDRLFVIDLESAQNSLEIHQTANGKCLVLRHSSVRVPHRSSTDQKGSEKNNTKKRSRLTQKRVDAGRDHQRELKQ